jgi:uncharacterized protein YjeT (DUF2065 family)
MCYLVFKGQVQIGTIVLENFDAAILDKDLILTSAGTTEVMQRQETLQNLQNLWPIVQNSPAGQVVLLEIIRLMIPTLADKVILALSQAPDKQLIASLVQVIQGIAQAHPEIIPQESIPQLQQLMQQAQASLTQGQPTASGATASNEGQQNGKSTQPNTTGPINQNILTRPGV